MVETNIRVVLRALDGFTSRIVQKIVLDAVANLIEDTPVDTGWARANWVPSIGEAFEGTAGSRAEAEEGALDAGPQQEGIAQIATGYRIQNGDVFITNNVPYIRFLNEGSSSQAPAGFVQAAIGRAVDGANRIPSP